jgi:hypothetical protein
MANTVLQRTSHFFQYCRPIFIILFGDTRGNSTQTFGIRQTTGDVKHEVLEGFGEQPQLKETYPTFEISTY